MFQRIMLTYPICKIKHQHYTMCTSVECSSDCFKSFLTRCIPLKNNVTMNILVEYLTSVCIKMVIHIRAYVYIKQYKIVYG